MRPLQLTPGEVFGSLTVLSFSGKSERGAGLWLCRCVCGEELPVDGSAMKAGRNTSCGCQRVLRLASGSVNRTHGKSKTAEYKAWKGMRARCLNPRHHKYRIYGGRGITICQRWLDSFEDFRADVGPRPSHTHSIDRIEVNGNYEPGNVRWATPSQQAQNRRNLQRHSPETKNKISEIVKAYWRNKRPVITES